LILTINFERADNITAAMMANNVLTSYMVNLQLATMYARWVFLYYLID